MELNFVETLRRRWKALGIEEDAADASDQPEMQVPEDEAARQEILNGAIVRHVIQDAAKGKLQSTRHLSPYSHIQLSALPRLRTFTSLLELLQTYPTPLASSLIQHTYDLVASHLPSNSKARVLYADRHLNSTLHPDQKGPPLVDAIKEANEELTMILQRSEGLTGMPEAYSEWIEERFRTIQDPNLASISMYHLNDRINRSFQKLYLLSSLHNICARLLKARHGVISAAPSVLLSTHLSMLSSLDHPPPTPDPQKVLKLARKYTARSSSPALWLARLKLEETLGEDMKSAWEEARQHCEGEHVSDVWKWGLQDTSIEMHEVCGRTCPLINSALT